MKTAFITLSKEGMKVVARLAPSFPESDCFVHESQEPLEGMRTFKSVVALTADVFGRYDALVYVAPCGAVVRAIASRVNDKKSDPGVVAVDVGGRYTISLLGGHEGGANHLAVTVSNLLGAEPVITTTTEAVKDHIVGVGCKKGKPAAEIAQAIRAALKEADVALKRVRFLASADIKMYEEGLLRAAETLGVPVRFIPSDVIRGSTRNFRESAFVKSKVNLPAVAEPCALIAGRRTSLLFPKRKYNGVTVAIARENCSSLG